MRGLPNHTGDSWRVRAGARMGGKGGGSAPPPPNPQQTAQAQQAANEATARTQAALNRVDTYTPFGSQTFTNLGGDRWRSDINLSPNQQAIATAQEQAQQGLFGLANQAIPRVQQAFGTQLDFSGLPNPIAQGNDIAASARAVGDQIYNTGRERLAPDFARQLEDMKQDLANRGIPIGSDAYTAAQRGVYNSQNDTLAQLAANAQAASTSQLQGQTALAQALRQQGIQEQSLLRSQPIDDVSRLLGLSGGPSVPQFGQIAQTQVQPTDVTGPVYANYNAQLQQWQQRQQANNAAMTGLFGLAGNLGSTALASWLAPAAVAGSDRRLKRDIRRVGQLPNGLPVYLFRYRAGGPMQIGLMADDVERVHPAAVVEIGGMKHVDYAQAVT